MKIIFIFFDLIVLLFALSSANLESNTHKKNENSCCLNLILLSYLKGRVRQNFVCDDIFNQNIKLEFDCAQI